MNEPRYWIERVEGGLVLHSSGDGDSESFSDEYDLKDYIERQGPGLRRDEMGEALSRWNADALERWKAENQEG